VTTEALFTAADLRRLDRLAVLSRRRLRGEAAGERPTRRVGAGGEFADHRTYVPGDDLRYVDWNVWFRLGETVVKRFEAEDAVSILLCVDRSLSMAGRKGEEARRLAGAIAHVALRRRDGVALAWLPRVPERPVELFRDASRAPALFARLRETPGEGATAHVADLERILPAVPRRGPAVVLSDFFDPAGAVRGLARLTAHGFETTALQIVDAADVDLPVGESVRAVDRETGDAMELDVTPAFLEALHAAWRRRAERMRAWCLARQVGWQRVDVGRPMWDVLRDMIRAGVVFAS
jgi:uncharacterized protein (DUF58 family)